MKKKIALLAGCLLVLACSSNGERAGMGQGGQGGGQTGGTGGSGHGGSTGSAGNSGNGGGQPGGSTGSAGNSGGGGQAGSDAGGRGGSGATAGNTGGGGQAGTAGQGGDSGGHAGGRAGQGGGGGKTGQGGAGGNGPSCTELQTAYAKAISNARMCNLASSATQCAHLVPSALSCGCPVWVNDTAELDRIKAQWDAAGCTPGIVCPALACVSAGTHAVCVPIDSGDFCMGTNGPT